VSNFVSHHASELGFVVCGQKKPFVDVKEAARKCECVNLIRIDNFDREGNFCIRVEHDVLTYTIDVFSDEWVVNKLRLSIDLCRQLSTKSNFFLGRAAHLRD